MLSSCLLHGYNPQRYSKLIKSHGGRLLNHCARLQNNPTKGGESSVVDGLAASSNWRRGELTKLSDRLTNEPANDTSPQSSNEENKGIDTTQPLSIKSDEDVQQNWKDMESRVTRRRSLTLAEAKRNGKGIGRKNMRKTDEEAWLEAGLYHKDEEKDN